jgi:peroxiredoxin
MRISNTIKSMAITMLMAGTPLAIANANPQIGAPAPAFSGMTASGKTIALSDLKGKTVVLEWTNKDCPYVRKHYESGNMQTLQKESKADHKVVWVSVISSAPGTQGYLEREQALGNIDATGAAPDHLVLDAAGTIGKSYGAVTTPHMYIIDPNGTLAYMGGIDDKPSSRQNTIEGATNYVRLALDDMAANRQVAQAVTRPYGCSVKYAN